ncbi:MAG: transporter substrate-binding domain-containing protein [Cellulosilyticaceae bacterium]
MKENQNYLIKISLVILFLIFINMYVLTHRPIANSSLGKDELIVGMELKFPPFETIDAAGNPTGVSVDLANALGEELGVSITIKSLDYPSLIPALQSQNIDLIISSMTITEERLESISFSDEYAKSDLALLLNQSATISNWAALNTPSSTVAVKQGTLGAMWAKKHLPSANLKEFSEVSAAMLDVNNGFSDAFIYDPLSLIEGSHSLTQTKLLLDPLPEVKGWGIGMRKNDIELQSAINSALKKIKDNHFFDAMRTKYLQDDVKKYESYGLNYLF